MHTLDLQANLRKDHDVSVKDASSYTTDGPLNFNLQLKGHKLPPHVGRLCLPASSRLPLPTPASPPPPPPPSPPTPPQLQIQNCCAKVTPTLALASSSSSFRPASSAFACLAPASASAPLAASRHLVRRSSSLSFTLTAPSS